MRVLERQAAYQDAFEEAMREYRQGLQPEPVVEDKKRKKKKGKKKGKKKDKKDKKSKKKKKKKKRGSGSDSASSDTDDGEVNAFFEEDSLATSTDQAALEQFLED